MVLNLYSRKYGIKKVIIDDEDYELYKSKTWSLRYNSHAKSFYCSWHRVGGKTIYLHRLIMGAKDRTQIVDHINHDTMDNRKNNLRICSIRESNRNTRSRISNISGYKGVSFSKIRNKWWARIGINYESIDLGYFDDKKDAARAYNEAAKKYHGEFALLNAI
jgi:hypothetical protein